MIDWISGLPALSPVWDIWLLVPITIAVAIVALAVWRTGVWLVLLPVALYIAAVMLWPSAWLFHWVFWVPFALGLLALIWVRWLGYALAALSGIAILAVALSTFVVPSLSNSLAVCGNAIIPVQARVASNEFIPNSLPSSNLLWSDSVSTPFTGKTPSEMLNEVLAENGGNPTVLLMNVEGLSSIVIDEDGTTIGDINPCFGEFIELAKNGGMAGDFLTEGNTRVIEAVTRTAERVNTLLLRLKLVDHLVVGDSLWNWHINAREGLAIGGLPIATLNDVQERNGKFAALWFYGKTGKCVFGIGYDAGLAEDSATDGGDKRLVGLPCESAPPPPGGPPPSEPPTDEPPCVTDCPKIEEVGVDPIQGVDPNQPVGIFEPTPSPSPTPGVTNSPGSDPSPSPSPSVPIVEEDEEVIPTPEETTTPIVDPDAQ